jgi:RNA polymerase sigma factor (sigma-70 family)
MSEAAAAAGLSRWLSDERLTRRAIGGDERAFGAIFRRYHQSLYRYSLAIVGNPEDAQDALQNTMVKVMRALPGEERTIELKPWLYRIAHNESIDLLRRRRESRHLDAEQATPGRGLAEDVATRERLRRLLVDLRELPERQREVLVMRELAGLGFDEIGAALETSEAGARQTLYEARQSLRQMEEGREMGCDEVTRALSDGDGRVIRRRDVRAHLRACAECRRFRDDIKERRQDLAAISPLPAVAAAAMLQGLVGGSGATGGGLAAVLGGGAAKTISTSAAAKGVATVAVAAVGVTAADRSGVIHVGLPGEGGAKPSQSAPAVPGPGPSQGSPGSGGQAAAGSPGDAEAARKKGRPPRGKRGADAQKAPAGSKPEGAKVGGRGQGQGPQHDQGDQHGNAPEASQTPGPPEHADSRGQEKQQPGPAADGQEKAAASKPPPGERGGGGKAETPPKEKKEPKQEKEPKPSPSPPPEPRDAPANPPPAAPEPPGQAPPHSQGKGPEGNGPPSSPGRSDADFPHGPPSAGSGGVPAGESGHRRDH